MSRAVISQATRPLRGTALIPGDKSVSHRRALLSLFVGDEVRLRDFNDGEDCAATLRCLEALGKRVVRTGNGIAISGPCESQSAHLDCGNSGTTARMLLGILAARDGQWIVEGDASLSRRPMERVAEPLGRMGAQIELTDGHLPARIRGAKLHAIDYESPVASAQVKSAVLLAALQAEGVTLYREPVLSRDHTERLLGVRPDSSGALVLDPSKVALQADVLSGAIPGDASAAAYCVAAALLVPGSELRMEHVLASPPRLSYVSLLEQHGANVLVNDAGRCGGEEIVTLMASFSEWRGFEIAGQHSTGLIDEIPILSILATRARSKSRFENVGELRAKESDRLAAVVAGLSRMGARVRTWNDGFAVEGDSELHGAEIETHGDHRLAMVFAVAGLAARGTTVIRDAECVSVSHPRFWQELARLAPDCIRMEN